MNTYNPKTYQSSKYTLWFFFGLLCLIMNSCAILPPMTPQEKRAMQVRSYDTTYENVFRAFKNVLQDEGYVIKNQDMTGGLITASKKTSNSYQYGSGLSIGGIHLGGGTQNGNMGRYPTGDEIEASINLEKINKNTTETRMNLQSTKSFSDGQDEQHEITDLNTFSSIYQRVSVEIERRKAMGRE